MKKTYEINGAGVSGRILEEVGLGWDDKPTVSIDLPDLNGTDKQVEWASRLREDAIVAMVLSASNSPARAAETLRRLAEFQTKLQAWVDARPTAKAWIDAR